MSLFAEHTHHLRTPPGLEQLTRLGPARLTRRPLATLACGSPLHLETCRYPDGSQLVEISVKCAAEHAADTAREITRLLECAGGSPSRPTNAARSAPPAGTSPASPPHPTTGSSTRLD